MYNNLDVFSTAMAMARHAGHKQALSARNVANADTPGYRAVDLPEFHSVMRDMPAGGLATRTGHMHGNRDGLMMPEERRDAQDPNGNTVSLELEMIDAVAAKRQHDRALMIYRHGMTVLRSAISRN